jgi:predicted HicB family RNase H-like nuclease
MKSEYLILRISKKDKELIRTKANKKKLSISSYARMQLLTNN